MTETRTLHESAIVFDGLVVSNWSREVFEDMRRGGLTSANCTCCVWENTRDTMVNIARWKQAFADHADLIMPVRKVADIRDAKRQGKVGILLGWQNTSGFEDRVDFLPLFKDMGVGVIQLTYNTQNFVASGCWEERDSGLSGFGREAIDAMNRLGIVVDLSHVGPKSCTDAIAYSRRPCVYTHVAARGLFDHPRNKSDAQLREIVDKGGFVGVTGYPLFMKRGADTVIDDYVEMFEYMIDVCGEANVGIGTDATQGHGAEFFEWVRRDKGYARMATPSRGRAPLLKDMETLGDYPRLTEAMQRRRWSEQRILAVLGENWLRFLEEGLEPLHGADPKDKSP